MSSDGQAFDLEKVKQTANQSPFYRHLNLELVAFSDKGCFMTMKIEDKHLNINGKVHGGAIASLADSACSLALATVIRDGEFMATQNLDVNYIAPAGKGVLKARGWVVHRGRSTAILEADIFDASGNLIAHAHTVHAIRKASGASCSRERLSLHEVASSQSTDR